MDIIKTPRLILRPIIIDDARDIYEYCSEPNVGPNAGWKPHESIGETRELMKSLFIGKENVFGIVYNVNNKIIGTIGLVADPRRENPKALMLGYALSEKYWNMGFMTEAAKAVIKYGFSNLDIDIISCNCYSDNPRSEHVIRNCGFKYEGCLELGEVRYDGVVKDVLCFSLRRINY